MTRVMAGQQTSGISEGKRVSELAESTVPLSLDVVRARIFYLACDVEPLSPPAAMLLRAVADAIEDNGAAAESLSQPANGNGMLASMFSPTSTIRTISSQDRNALPTSERRLGIVSSQSGYKR